MPEHCVPFKETGYFTNFICDYLEEEPSIKPFYNRYPSLKNFAEQIKEKQASFPNKNREVLFEALKRQYNGFTTYEATLQNLEALKNANAFTVVTGHQLNLFTGPLYFLYKIITTINLAKKLNETYPDFHVVPVYWMATEDHDFDEINHFNFRGKKFRWGREAGGAVGELSTKGLDAVLELYAAEIGKGINAEFLRNLFEDAYLRHTNLADATRYLANKLFGEYGIVIVDGNDAALKALFIPYSEEELNNQTSFKKITETIEAINALGSGYTIQVNPREINLFYLIDGVRERIVFENGFYLVNETNLKFTHEEIMLELQNHPERFSPNVMMRPLYQEVILPNLCYIGGGGELAYWLQLKGYFEASKVPFPMLMLRNSALLVTEKQHEKLKKLNIGYAQLFLKRDTFINRKVREISNIDIDFSKQKKQLQEQFEHLYQLAKLTDKTFLNAVKAQEVKQLKGLDALEKRLLKAQKRKLADEVARMVDLQNQLFPNGSLQERTANFSEFYVEYGERLMPKLMEELDPFSQEFLIIKV